MTAHHTRTTLRGLLARTVVRNLVWAAAALASWSVVAGLAGPVQTGVLGHSPSPEPAPDRAALLVERHDCWTGAAPAGTEPARAVVTLPGGRASVVGAGVGYRIWLDDRPGVLHAFCP